MDEVWPGVPRCDVQLDQPITRYPEGDNILDPRARVVAKVARWIRRLRQGRRVFTSWTDAARETLSRAI